MGPFLCGFSDELTKLGRALSPAEQQTRAQPVPTPRSPTGPIAKTRPSPSIQQATKAPRPKVMKPLNPYGPGYKAPPRGRFEFSRPKSTAPRVGTARMIRPSNAAGPSPEGLRAIPRQEMRSPPAKAKRSTYRPSPRYRPKPAPDPVKKPVTKRGKRRGKKPTGKMRDRLPGESGGAYATRKFLSAAERAMDPVARTKREYPGIKTPEAKARTPGQPAYKVRAKSDYEKYTKPSADAARKETNFALIPGTPQYKSRFGGKGPTSEADRKQVAYAIRKAKRKPGYTLPSAAQSWEGPDLISKERKQSERGLAASRKALSRMRPSE